jgi:hypothetical protein
MLIVRLLREISFHAVEQLVHAGCRALCVSPAFGDDTLSYFTERLDPVVTRAALIATLHRAKRNQAFQNSRFIAFPPRGQPLALSPRQEPLVPSAPVPASQGYTAAMSQAVG